MTHQEFANTATASLLSSSAAGEAPRRPDRLFGIPQEPGWSWRAALASLSLVALLTVAGRWVEPVIKGPNLVILYTLVVVFSALRWGRRAAILSAVAGTLTFDFFFVPPRMTFVPADVWYLVTLLGFLTVGLLTSMLTIQARHEAQLARRREALTAALYSLTQSLAAENELDRIIKIVARHIRGAFQEPVVLLLPGAGALAVRFRSPELVLDEAAAKQAFESGKDATGAGIRYRPLRNWEGTIGVLGVREAGPLSGDQQELLGAIMNQAAMAITRADLAEKAQRAELLLETGKFQKALLNSVSHDLRTPLVSVIGGINSVLQDAALLDAATQRTLLETARDEAVRLNRLVQNLLDMTRLEGGAVRVKKEPCDVHDVVGAALEQLGDAARSHPVVVTIAPDLPLVPMDHVLIVQVLVNLLDNALKYSRGPDPIEIDARLKDGQLEVRVDGRGNQIPDQELERVFDKFFRGSTSAGTRGSGLGLSICKGFVTSHHGRMWAERGAQPGTVFVFSLPLESES